MNQSTVDNRNQIKKLKKISKFLTWMSIITIICALINITLILIQLT